MQNESLIKSYEPLLSTYLIEIIREYEDRLILLQPPALYRIFNIFSEQQKNSPNQGKYDEIIKMQQSSMPVLHRHKKKGSKSTKNSNNNSINQPPNTPELNNDLNSTKNQNNNETNFNLNSNHNSPQVQDQNTQINTNMFSPPPKSTPFSPPILNIDLNSTLTSNSLSAKLGCQGETESKGQPDHSDDLISIF